MDGRKTICLRAHPAIRLICPDGWRDGWWQEIPADTEEIRVPTPLRDIVARPTGEIVRNSSLLSAPVWEARWETDWTDQPDQQK